MDGPAVSHDPFSDERGFWPYSCPGSSSGSGANPLHDYPFNQVFFEIGRFKREKTGAFSGLPLGAEIRRSSRSCGIPGGHKRGITVGKERGFLIGEN